MGFGIVAHAGSVPSFFIYSEGNSTALQRIDALSDWNEPLGTAWGYAFSDETELGLAAGETKVLAVYRKVAGNTIRPIDDSNPDALAAMIRDHKLVLLLKMKVEWIVPS
jgi:hypothetical protein